MRHEERYVFFFGNPFNDCGISICGYLLLAESNEMSEMLEGALSHRDLIL